MPSLVTRHCLLSGICLMASDKKRNIKISTKKAKS